MDDRAAYVRQRVINLAQTPQQRASLLTGAYLDSKRWYDIDRPRLWHAISHNKRRPMEALRNALTLFKKHSELSALEGKANAANAIARNASSLPGTTRSRVLLLVHELSLTGAPKVIIDLFSELEDKIEFRTLSLEGGKLKPQVERQSDLRVTKQDPLSPLRVFKRRAQKAEREEWQRWVDEFRPDVVYINSVAALPLLGQLNIPQCPTILHTHEMGVVLDMFYTPSSHLLAGRKVRHIIDSESARASFCRHTGLAESEVKVINPGIPEAKFAGGKSTIQNEKVVIGGCGTIQWRKSPETWLLMAKELLKQVSADEVSFVWVGTYDSFENEILKDQIRLLGLQEHIRLVPITPFYLDHVKQFDIFTITSWEDPCPLVVMENMMLGIPVVCFRGGGGSSEEVGDAGVVVEEFNPSAMAQEVAKLVRNRELREQLGAKGRERALGNFTCQIQAPKILAEILAAKQDG